MEPVIGMPSRGERVREFARCHALVAVLLGAGLVLRVLTTLTYRPAMQSVQDSFDYLHEAEQMVPSVFRPPAGVIGATLLEQRLRT